MTPREQDEFKRIQRITEIERAREIVTQYEEGLTFYRRRIEDYRYQLGRIDERLGERRGG